MKNEMKPSVLATITTALIWGIVAILAYIIMHWKDEGPYILVVLLISATWIGFYNLAKEDEKK